MLGSRLQVCPIARQLALNGLTKGQDRAVKAINFGLAMEDPSYNIFVTGFRGTGRTTIVNDLLHKVAYKKDKPNDWLFVYNFDNPDEPKALNLPSRKARGLLRHFNRPEQIRCVTIQSAVAVDLIIVLFDIET